MPEFVVSALMLCLTYLLNERLERKKLQNTKRLDYLERQLSEYYWPLYMRLEMDKVIYERILNSSNNLKAGQIERNFLQLNRNEIIKMFQSKGHLMECHNTCDFVELLEFTRAVTERKAFLKGANKDDYGDLKTIAPTPQKLLDSVENTANELQKMYDRFVNIEIGETTAE